MSDEKPDEPKQIPGYTVAQEDNGRWYVVVLGQWWVNGFESAEDAHEWLMDFMLRNAEVNARDNRARVKMAAEMKLQRELAEKEQEHQRELEGARVLAGMPPVKKGREN